jgi:guanylate kinase
LPPSISVLEQRLRNRGQDSEQIIEKRMKAAVAEMQHFAEYDYLVVNDVFKQALSDLKSIVIAQRLKVDRQQKQLAELIQGLLFSENN